MSVDIKAQFKKADRELNGLEAISKELIDDPLKRHVVIGVVEVARVVTDYEEGSGVTPVVKFLQIEPMRDSAIEQARELLAAAFNARTGQAVQESLFDHKPEPEPAGDGDQAAED